METDLWIACSPAVSGNKLREFIIDTIISLRKDVTEYNRNHPEFITSHSPLPVDSIAPPIIQKMLNAAILANVGPMAAVAGAFAEMLGQFIKREFSLNELIIENGGDIYLEISHPVLIKIYAGGSKLSDKIALKVSPENSPLGICTSSGKIGHSLSFGIADAVTIACKNSAEADAFATAFGNKMRTADDIDLVIAETQAIQSILSALVIFDDKMGIQGKLDLQIIGH